jgi:hypothetical protein
MPEQRGSRRAALTAARFAGFMQWIARSTDRIDGPGSVRFHAPGHWAL